METEFSLGIDIGTTSVKLCLVDKSTNQVIKNVSESTNAWEQSDIGQLGFEQDCSKICFALQSCILKFSDEEQKRIKGIAITGQMHGIILWHSSELPSVDKLSEMQSSSKQCSNLYTWMDQRCSTDFLIHLPKPLSHLKIATGFGCVTLFWLVQNQPGILHKWNCSGSIMDFIVAVLCQKLKSVTSNHIAASWGYYDTVSKSWNESLLKKHKFPFDLLPEVVDVGTVAGHTSASWGQIPSGTPVYVALGDVQCAFLSSLKSESDAVVNIGTSLQLGFLCGEKHLHPLEPESRSDCIEYVPYLNGQYLALAASLNGGKVVSEFVRMLQSWFKEFEIDINEEDIWRKLFLLADDAEIEGPTITPTLFGERHTPDVFASITGITNNNMRLGSTFKSLCEGVIINLSAMMSRDFLVRNGVQRIIASGNVIAQNCIIRHKLEAIYSLPIVYEQCGNSAFGATKMIK